MRSSKIFLLVLFYYISVFATLTAATEPQLCKSLEITTLKGLETLRNCKVIVGHVRLVNLQLTPTTAVPASIVEEITDYLLVYRVHGLQSLQRIFPRLKLIRGQDLLFNKYSLVVLENRELENLGLISLLRIQKGNLRIENNPVLCFVDTVNWVFILGNNTKQDISFKNKPSHQCPLCNETLADIDDSYDGSLRKHCWNLDAYQIFGPMNCTRHCGNYGCNAIGDCCSPNCLTGCSDQNCELCATFNHMSGCKDICPFSYFQLNKRECVSQSFCLSRGLIPYSGACLEKCPPHYENVNNTCGNPCAGEYIIREAADIAALVGCQYIRGSLTIELDEIKAKIVTDLEKGLNKIREITKYLKVKNSPQIMTLQFLSSLHTIKGEELIDGKYALLVVNNYHLEQIWNPNQNVAILKGRIYFHLNPRLCYDKIMKLTSSIKSVQKIEAPDVSPNSNGERVVCGENIRELNATVEDLNATAVRIRVSAMSAEDINLLIGYAHYYKEAPVRNVTWYDGRHGCGHDDWMMDISPNRYVRHVIRNLKPYTQYAYFVKTLTMTDYHMQLDAYSNIQYFRTLPSKPGPVAKVYFHTLSTSEIMIHWWPPFSPNGKIVYYLVNHMVGKINSSHTDASQKANYLNDTATKIKPNDVCKCEMKLPFYSGPLPADENYYSKEQIIYDEALANFIYVPRSMPTETKNEQNTEKSQTKTKNQRTKRDSVSNEENMTTTTTKTTKPLTKDEEAEERFQKMHREHEQKAWDLQNTNLTDFKIVKPLPICSPKNVKNLCRVIEHYEGVKIPGHMHQYLIDKLQPEVTYNISVRACLESGECGAETTVLAKTISKILEDFLNRAQDLSKDIDE